MTRSATRLIAMATAMALALVGCSGSKVPAQSDQSALESGIKAPPVPKDDVDHTSSTTTSTNGSASPTTSPTAATPTYWVDPKGDDAAAGTKAAPFHTLHHGVGVLKPGDTLLLSTGTYTEVDAQSSVIINGLNGTADQWITIAAAPGAKPKVNGGEWQIFLIENSSYVEVRGLEIEGSAATDRKPTTGIEVRDSHHLRLASNYVHDGGGGGIGASKSNHIEILDNYISGMSKWNAFQTSGISTFESSDIGGSPDADGYSMHITGNVVFGNENIALPVAGGSAVTDGNCIIIDTQDTTSYTGKTYIANNVCSNNGGRGIHVFQSSNVVAVNNTLYHNMQTPKLKEEGAELSAVNAHNVVFRNNLVVPRADRKATVNSGAKSVSFDTNIYEQTSGSAEGNTNRVVTDAGLANPAEGDFSLKRGSPAIDAGNAADAPSADQKHTVRRGKPDVGALEASS